jgi:hypothetical protein
MPKEKDYIKEAEQLLKPKRMELTEKCKNDENWQMVKGYYNEAIEACKPIITKFFKVIDELKKEQTNE